MAIYHMNVGFVSRSSGRSSVQSCAYITGEKLSESRRGIVANYKNSQSDVSAFGTLIPDHVDASFKDLSVWDKLETFEDLYSLKRFPNCLASREKYQQSAQTAMTIVVALPIELDLKNRQDLVEEFANTRFVARGLIVTYALHEAEGNPHAHLQISRRSVTEDGEFSWAKDRDICLKSALLETRKLWADLTNSYLEREGFEAKITEKSFADLGINLEPGRKNGWGAYKRERDGESSRLLSENREIIDQNRERILANPGVVLEEITHHKAVFTQGDLLKLIQKRVGGDPHYIGHVFEKALLESLVVGENKAGQTLYTSKSYHDMERATLLSLFALSGFDYGQKTYGLHVALSEYLKENPVSYAYSVSQKDALFGLLDDKRLMTLVGRAGSGKTSILKPVCKAYQAMNHTVIGGSLSALASSQLGGEADIESRTLHSWLHIWRELERAEDQFLNVNSVMHDGLLAQMGWFQTMQRLKGFKLTKDHVFLIDEAGMVGTNLWHELLHFVQKSGCKVIAIGDDHQFKAIGAGDIFRMVVSHSEEKETSYHLNDIVRQKEGWMREASASFANLDVYHGLSLYENKGHVHGFEGGDGLSMIAHAYLEKMATYKSGFVLAYTNHETNAINDEIRGLLRDNGTLKDDVIMLRERSFAVHDKVVFLENNTRHMRIYDKTSGEILQEKIQNGLTGVLSHVDERGYVHVDLSSHKAVCFDPTLYDHLNHAYALTTHKSQGQTVDFTIVKASSFLDAKGLYVAMTRHRFDTQLFYDTKDFKDFKALQQKMSRFDHKDLVCDYTISHDQKRPWQNVQDYTKVVQDMAFVLRQKDNHGRPDFHTYNQFKIEQKELAQTIIADYDRHHLYVHQAGLTKSMLAVTSGLIDRPLSQAEQNACERVDLYSQVLASLKVTLKDLDDHYFSPQKGALQEAIKTLRMQRDDLAEEILKNKPLHRDFVNARPNINFTMMENQVAYRLQKDDAESCQNQAKDLEQTTSFHQNSSKQSFDYKAHIYQVKEHLNTHIGDLAYEFLGKPDHKTPRAWRYGKKGSLAIHVAGVKTGLYANFETGSHGGALQLIQDHLGCDHRQAFKWGSKWLQSRHFYDAKDQTLPTPSLIRSLQKEQAQPDVATYKVLSKETPFPDLATDHHLSYMLKNREMTGVYVYRNQHHDILGYVVRFEDEAGHKITPMLTYQDTAHHQGWRWKGFGNNRPLYGLEQLSASDKGIDKPILIVEGEKTADVARTHFKNHHVLTWSGGAGAVLKSDWGVLEGKDVTIWPDHDKAGENAASKIAYHLKENFKTDVKIVSLDPKIPHKWDLADAIPDHVNIHDYVKQAKVYEGPVLEKDMTISSRTQNEKPAKEIYDIPQKSVDMMANALDITLHQNDYGAEKSLIDSLYDIYRIERPYEKKVDMLAKAVLVGHHMQDHLLSHQDIENDIRLFQEDAYKIGLSVYHAFDGRGTEEAYSFVKDLHQTKELDSFIQDQDGFKDKDKEDGFYFHYKDVKIALDENPSWGKALVAKEKENSLHVISQKDIEHIAEKFGSHLNRGYEHAEVALINSLYEFYKQMSPHENKIDMLVKAVSVGLHMHDHILNKGDELSFHSDVGVEAYKIALTAYHSIDSTGSHLQAFNHAIALHHEGHLDDHMDYHLKNNSHYHHDMNIDHHMKTITEDLKVHEHHFEEIHRQHQELTIHHHFTIDL